MPRSISIGRPMLLTLVVAIGIAVGWGFVALWTGIIATQARVAHRPSERLYVRVDGEPFIFRAHREEQAVLTLDGQRVAVDQQLLLHPQYVYPPGTKLWDGAMSWARRMTAANDGGTPAIYWYLVHDGRTNGQAYGIGYHSSTKHVAGYFGRNGFADRLPPRDEWFEIEGSHGLATATGMAAISEPSTSLLHEITVLADRQLWIIDLHARTVKAVAKCDGPATLGSAWKTLEEVPNLPALRQTTATSWVQQKLLLRERERITLVDRDSGDVRTYPLPEELQAAYFGVFELTDGKLLIATHELAAQLDETLDQALVWLDSEGKIVERTHVRLSAHGGSSAGEIAWASIAAAPFPLATGLFTFVMQSAMIQQGQADSFAGAFPQVMALLWPAMVVVTIIGLITAVAAYRRQRRFALPHATLWALFAFVFGVPGWLAYRFHRVWPVMAACPACHQPAPRDRQACSECGATFPPPAPKGVEVYA